MKRFLFSLLVVFGFGVIADVAPFALGDRATISIKSSASTLNRATGRIETRVTVVLSNRSDRSILAPLHMVIALSTNHPSARVTGALGGFDTGPYQAHYLDCSDSIGSSWLPGSAITREFNYERAAGIAMGYTLSLYAVFNRDPVITAVTPQATAVGTPVSFDATSSSDPEGQSLSFQWTFGDGYSSTDPAAVHQYDRTGLYSVRLAVTDPQGGTSVVIRSVRVSPAETFALAQVRTLDGVGQPLKDVMIQRSTPTGVTTARVDDVYGFFVGEGEAGRERWIFTASNHLPVWRDVVFSERDVTLVPSPWMAKTPLRKVSVTPLAASSIGEEMDPAIVSIPAGSFTQPSEATLTPLDGQTLPFPLPSGWSPLAAFHVGLSAAYFGSSPIKWNLPSTMPMGTTAVVTFDTDSLEWRVIDLPPGGQRPGGLANESGWYAVVIADAGESGPPVPVLGSALPAAASAQLGVASASGLLDPSQAPASLDPDAVTTRGQVTFNGTNTLSSGQFFRAQISERYELNNDSVIQTPDYDTTFFAYRHASVPQPSVLKADFSLRPTLLLPPEDLAEALIHVRILQAGDYGGSIVSSSGGFLRSEHVELQVPQGAFNRLLVVELREIDVAGFSGLVGSNAPSRAFVVNCPSANSEIEATFFDVKPSRDFVLARLISVDGGQKLEPVARLHSDPQGTARSIEPAAGQRLSGVRGGGRYVLVEVPSPHGLVHGVVRTLNASVREGLAAFIRGAPWATTTSSDGSFSLVAEPGTGFADGLDPADDNRGSDEFALSNATSIATVDIQVVVTGPRVVSVSPANNQNGVPVITKVRVTFSEPIKESSFGLAGLALLDATEQPVPATVVLTSGRKVAELLPADPLSFRTNYTVVLSDELTDDAGNEIEGDLEFAFQTAPPVSRGLGAQLTIYQPGATNLPADVLDKLVAYVPGQDPAAIVVHGSQGSADPDVPVVLVNESSGETSTVLSKPDGSFYGVIQGTEEDFVSATFVNGNGTRITIPVSRQEFDNGFTGLYNQGGILEAESDGGPVQVFIEPESIPSRSKFKVDTVELAMLLKLLTNSLPADAKILGAATISHETPEDLSKPGKISMPFDPSSVQLPPGITAPADAKYALASVWESEDGEYVYEIIDSMRLENGQLITESPPYLGIIFKTLAESYKKTSQYKLKRANKLFEALGLPNVSQTLMHQLMLPVMMSQGNESDVIGTVFSVKIDEAGDPQSTPVPVPGAVVTFERPPFAPAGRLRPGQLVCTSDEKGRFAFRFNIGLEGDGYILAATHPRFSLQRAVEPSLIGNLAQRLTINAQVGAFDVKTKDLYFAAVPSVSTGDLLPPVISAGHTPSRPVSGTNGVDLVVHATDDLEIETLSVSLLDTVDFQGRSPTNVLVKISPQAADKSATRILQTFKITSDRSVRARLTIQAADKEGKITTQIYALDFDRPPLVSGPGVNDGTAPLRVLMAWPPNDSTGHAPFPEITLRFSKPLPDLAFSNMAPPWITVQAPHRLVSATPSPDFREAYLRVEGASEGDLKLTVGSPLQDRDGNPFDQNPSTTNTSEQFSYSISLVPPSVSHITLTRGGGIRGQGALYYVLDKVSSELSQLVVYDLKSVSNAVEVSRFDLLPNASDLAFIPNYTMPSHIGGPCATRDVLMVFGGEVGGATEPGSPILTPKWVRLIDVSDPRAPSRLSGAVISYDPISLITKVQAAPPLVAYLESSADATGIYLFNLVSLALGHNATREQADQFPEKGFEGVDFNNDGEYCGPGEKPPLPELYPRTYWGAAGSFAPLDPRNRIIDFDMSDSGVSIVSALFRRDTKLAQVRVFLGRGQLMEDHEGNLTIPAGYEPKRIKFLESQTIFTNGQIRILDLAIVSLFAFDGAHALMLVDLSTPATPKQLALITLPSGSGVPNSIERRIDGTLALAVGTDILILDPRYLNSFDSAGNWMAPLNRITGFGTGTRSYVSDASGIQFSSLGSDAKVGFSGPTLRWVTFPEAPATVSNIVGRTDRDKHRVLSSARPVTVGRIMARTFSTHGSNATPVVTSSPSPDDHYYVIVHAPGGDVTNRQLDLLVASINAAGAIPDPRPLNTMPTVLVDDTTRSAFSNSVSTNASFKYNGSMPAVRMSDDPNSDLYNVYLAGPVTLQRGLSSSHASALANQLSRYFLRASHHLVAALSPQSGNPALSAYASRLLNQQILPGTSKMVPVISGQRPLVIVPGVMGSRLIDKNTFALGSGLITDLWIDPRNAVSSSVGGLNDLVLNPDGSGSRGTDIRAVDAVRNIGVDSAFTDIQGRFIDFFVKELGYKEYLAPRNLVRVTNGVNVALQQFNSNPGRFRLDEDPDWDRLAQQPDLFVFGYDWRQSLATNAASLKKYIELIKQANPDVDSVDIVAHSMGGLVSRRLILDNPDLVSRLITVCSPFLGAPKAIYTMLSGDSDEFKINLLIPSEVSKSISRYMPAMHQLMPNLGYFELGGRPMAEQGWDANRDGVADTVFSYSQYKDALDGRLLETTNSVHPKPISTNNEPSALHGMAGDNQYNWSADSSGVEYYNIVALQSIPETITQVQMEQQLEPAPEFHNVAMSLPGVDFFESEQVNGDFPLLPNEDQLDPYEPIAFKTVREYVPKRGAGDGTVPYLSMVRGYRRSHAGFNAPGTVMLPVLAADSSSTQMKNSSHLGVLSNTNLHQLLGRILSEGITPEEQPVLNLSIPATINEGAAVALSVNISQVPPDAAGVTPVILWDTGDGRVLSGATVTHMYKKPGAYTLSCSVSYPGISGAVESRIVNVGNVAHTVELSLSPTNTAPPVGSNVRLTAVINDPGQSANYRFAWTVDGEAQTNMPSNAYYLEQSFNESRPYNVSVHVTDSSGNSNSASVVLAVGGVSSSPAPQPLAKTPAAAPTTPTVSTESMTVFISGASLDRQNDIVIKHDGDRVGRVLPGVPLYHDKMGISFEDISSYKISIEIPRIKPGGGTLRETSIQVKANSDAVIYDVSFFDGTEDKCFTFFSYVEDGDILTLTIPWDELLDADIPELLAMLSSPQSVYAAPIACDAATPPIIRNQLDVEKMLLDLSIDDPDQDAIDETLVDQDPVTESIDTIGFIEGTPGSTEPDECGVSDEGKFIVRVRQSKVHPAAIPNNAEGVVVPDASGAVRDAGTIQPPNSKTELSEESAEEIREAVKTAFRQGAQTDLFKNFVISLSDLLILEQGTGANLWKPNGIEKLRGAYTKGKSDNDYELLMPVFRKTPITPSSPADRSNMVTLAHSVSHMQGDWYFMKPEGVDSSGRIMGPPPPLYASDDYSNYLATVVRWRYTIPDSLQTMAGRTKSVEFLKGEKFFPTTEDGVTQMEKRSIFDQPATPAEVISFALTMRLRQDAPLREILKDVSFFPFRREHFDFAVMSLEKPPPFGDDPLGDAGMGRNLLLLKWVLEGSILPEFNSSLSAPHDKFNPGINAARDLLLRTEVFQRLKDREIEVSADGYEWGIYQEFAALSESVPLRLRFPTSSSECLEAFGSYLKSHDSKSLKKLGKGAIRGAMARLAAEPTTRADLFQLDPAGFDADRDLKSYEHLIARIANRHIGLFQGFTTNDINGFLKAKIADKKFLNPLVDDTANVDAFTTRVLDFIRTQVQMPTVPAYSNTWTRTLHGGRPAEWLTRMQNVEAIDHGIQIPGGVERNGRDRMHGVLPGHRFDYPLVTSLRRIGPQVPTGPYAVQLTGGGINSLIDNIHFKGTNTLVVVNRKDADGNPLLATFAEPLSTQITPYSLTINNATESTIARGIRFDLEQYVLPTTFYQEPAFAFGGDRVMVYRGMSLDLPTLISVINDQLEQGKILSLSRVRGEADSVALDRLVGLMDQHLLSDTNFYEFNAGDVAIMTREEKAALYHTDAPPTNSAGISCSFRLDLAINFALVDPDKDAYVVAMEIPCKPSPSEKRYHYLPTSRLAPSGDRLRRAINPPEDEVAYLFEAPFLRAHLYEVNVVNDPSGDSIFQMNYMGTFDAPPAP